MPTLTRFLVRVGLALAAGFLVMLALATLVVPWSRPMTAPADLAPLKAALAAARAERDAAAAAIESGGTDPDGSSVGGSAAPGAGAPSP